jgi:hypothetical protein
MCNEEMTMPYPNEHSCRLREPDEFQKESFRTVTRKSASHNDKEYDVIRGQLKNSDEWDDQAFRYPKDTWNEGEAHTHCKEHKGRFEAAKKDGAESAQNPLIADAERRRLAAVLNRRRIL